MQIFLLFNTKTCLYLVLKDVTWWMSLCGALGVGCIAAIIIWFCFVPKIKKNILNKLGNDTPVNYSSNQLFINS